MTKIGADEVPTLDAEGIQFIAGRDARRKGETATAALMRSQLPHADEDAWPLIQAWLDGYDAEQRMH